jgi:hypothetical protein
MSREMASIAVSDSTGGGSLTIPTEPC